MKNEHKTHKRPLPIGFSDFKELRENGCYYIDKTLFIKEITKASAKVLLIPRPRRFGKTLNLSMLRYFYEKTGENQNALPACDETHLFKGLSVCNEDIFETHRERYPLIWLTFKDAKELDWKAMYRKLTNILRDEFLRHNILLKSDILEQTEQDYFEAILNRKAELPDYTDALRYLSDFLRRYHNERVVILIDEYDTPIHSAYAGGYYKEVVSFMRNLLSGGLKDNEHLFKGVVTGILRVAKESIFSGLNNLDVFTLLDEEFNSSFGFTDEEVRHFLKLYALSHRYDLV
ncbi:MAG: AAA family ATPase [Desulfobacterales bacterium]|nr:AAA family ATPase [Desulfobacterales bacterium]